MKTGTDFRNKIQLEKQHFVLKMPTSMATLQLISESM
jgi:hypothetical protein